MRVALWAVPENDVAIWSEFDESDLVGIFG
jgi:hypothetical protein